MTRKKWAKTHDEIVMDLINQFRRENPGPCNMDDVTAWIRKNDLLPDPKFNPARELTRKLKQVARRKRFKDSIGRTVRQMLAAKIERKDVGGNLLIDVVWDHLHEAGLEHLLLAFSQRDDIIDKQCRSATRDVESCLDFNPNTIGHEEQFKFGFMREEPATVMVELVKETPMPPNRSSNDGIRSPDQPTQPR